MNNNASLLPSCDSQAKVGYVWKTRAKVFGIPLICVAFGSNEKGKIQVAKGVIAIGQFAVGLVAIGQFGIGLIGIGQCVAGVVAFGQLALGLLVAFGQLSIGTFAVGQFVIGKFGRGQFGWAEYLWSPGRTDMEAVAMFETIEWLVHQDWETIWDNIKDAMTLGL
jgi:hypothetical protein